MFQLTSVRLLSIPPAPRKIIKITPNVVFPLSSPASQSLLHKAWELFIEYLAHSSFKDFSLANCFYSG